jgi:hypothetical protein
LDWWFLASKKLFIYTPSIKILLKINCL